MSETPPSSLETASMRDALKRRLEDKRSLHLKQRLEDDKRSLQSLLEQIKLKQDNLIQLENDKQSLMNKRLKNIFEENDLLKAEDDWLKNKHYSFFKKKKYYYPSVIPISNLSPFQILKRRIEFVDPRISLDGLSEDQKKALNILLTTDKEIIKESIERAAYAPRSMVDEYQYGFFRDPDATELRRVKILISNVNAEIRRLSQEIDNVTAKIARVTAKIARVAPAGTAQIARSASVEQPTCFICGIEADAVRHGRLGYIIHLEKDGKRGGHPALIHEGCLYDLKSKGLACPYCRKPPTSMTWSPINPMPMSGGRRTKRKINKYNYTHKNKTGRKYRKNKTGKRYRK